MGTTVLCKGTHNISSQVLEDYVQPKKKHIKQTGFYRYIEQSVEELDNSVEYDMDDQVRVHSPSLDATFILDCQLLQVITTWRFLALWSSHYTPFCCINLHKLGQTVKP